MSEEIRFTVTHVDAGGRADLVVTRRLAEFSRSHVQELFRGGHVKVNSREAKAAQRLTCGDEVRVQVVGRRPISAAPEQISLSIVYQDQDLVVVDKPAGLVVHPAPGHEHGTLANAVAALAPGTEQVGELMRPGIVHRLDKDTSGLIVVALSTTALRSLQSQIASREVSRRYLALATGRVEPEVATIEAPIGRDPNDRRRMTVYGVAGRPARTSYRVVERVPGFTLARVTLHTGRTHQIRVHFAALGHSLAGDAVYGGARMPGLSRQFLHAESLAFRSPSSGAPLEFHSPLPPDLWSVLDALRAAPA